MLKHHIKASIRSLSRNKFYSLINILGLSVGMGVSLAIIQYVHFQLSYDKFHVNSENTYRLILTKLKNGEESAQARTSYAMGVSGKEEIPEIKQFIRIHPQYFGAVVSNPEKEMPVKEDEENILFVDSVFLQVFNFPLKQGDPKTVLNEKYSIVITEETSEKYFGPNTDPIGKILKVDGWVTKEFIVTGVLKKLPSNSHLKFKFLIPIRSLLESDNYAMGKGAWGRTNFFTYVTIEHNSTVRNVEEKLNQVIDNHFGKSLSAYNEKWTVHLQPITDVHLSSSKILFDVPAIRGSILEVKIFSLIAAFTLIIAWINFINLSTARSAEREKAIGIRKSMGAFKNQLIHQFLVEAVIINIVSAVFSVIIAIAFLSILDLDIGSGVDFIALRDFRFWGLFIFVIGTGSIAAGFYPAFILSSFKSVNTQKANTPAPYGITLRKSIVIFQFFASALLISGTLLVYRQISFMKNEDVGFDKAPILVVRGPSIVTDFQNLPSKISAFKNELLAYPSILNITASGTIPSKGYSGLVGIRKLGDSEKDNQPGGITYVDYDFFQTYNFDFLAGRPFEQERITDVNGIIINEEAIKIFGLGSSEKALQRQLIIGKDTLGVLGVLKNYHWNSLKDPYIPNVFVPAERASRYFSIEMNVTNIPASLDDIRSVFNSVFEDNPFDYFFLDDEFNAQYLADLRFGKLFAIFSVITIFIACLGLFALVSFSTVSRIKEIGIRKVLGAEISNLILLLSKEYLLLLSIANVLAIPIIYYSSKYWLANYAFRITIGAELFIVPLLVLLFISMLTVGHRILVAAKSNPVDALKK